MFDNRQCLDLNAANFLLSRAQTIVSPIDVTEGCARVDIDVPIGCIASQTIPAFNRLPLTPRVVAIECSIATIARQGVRSITTTQPDRRIINSARLIGDNTKGHRSLGEICIDEIGIHRVIREDIEPILDTVVIVVGIDKVTHSITIGVVLLAGIEREGVIAIDCTVTIAIDVVWIGADCQLILIRQRVVVIVGIGNITNEVSIEV